MVFCYLLLATCYLLLALLSTYHARLYVPPTRGDHCAMVASGCKEEQSGKGVVTVRTPRGLGEAEWRRGLEAYAASRE